MALFSKKKNIEVRSDLMAPDSSGVLQSLLGTDTMTKAKALDIPAVNSSIKFIAESVSMIPIKLYREKDGEIDEVVGDNRVRLLNDETGDTLDAVQFWKAIIEDYYLGKGGFAYVNKVGTKIKSLHYVEESQVSVLKNDDPIFKDFNYQINGKIYKPFELLSFLRNTKDGATGTSILTDNNLILSVAYETLVFQEQLVKKGGNKKGFLQALKPVAQEVIDKLKQDFRSLYQNNSENIVVLGN
jgi:HK97 family phage portal protein